MAFTIVFYALKQKNKIASQKIWAFLILCFVSLVFWSLFMTIPMGLTLFVEHNVDRNFLGLIIQPQWALNINSIMIIIGGPLMAFFYNKLRLKGYKVTIPIQFTSALFFIGVGFVVLAISIMFANTNGLINFNWIIFSYILQSLGELCISPIGYAMIGQLIPEKIQNIMMGTWMMIIGVAAVFSNMFFKMAIIGIKSIDPNITNSNFFTTFSVLGISTIIIGFILLFLVPFLHKLIKEQNITDKPIIPS
jgi:POT family proton-dependent oligopeptide transporter